MFKVSPKYFPNKGWLEYKLSQKDLNYLNKSIENKTKQMKQALAGNISKSYTLEDKDNWFFKNVLVLCIEKYIEAFTDAVVPTVLTKNCAYNLNRFWVNFQKKYEFNPIHNHTGVFSFVIWMKIPSSYKEECKLPFIKHSNSQMANTFQLLFSDSLGHMSTFNYPLEPSNEGTMLFFPSGLNHTVYPFYTSNKERISISGNINLNPEEIINDPYHSV